jgi:hypothetical protein
MKTTQHLTPSLSYRVIYERSVSVSRRMSFFPMPLFCFDHCPEKRDESNPHTIGRGWLPFGPELKVEGQFIPFFGTVQSSIFQRHRKKDIPLLSCM